MGRGGLTGHARVGRGFGRVCVCRGVGGGWYGDHKEEEYVFVPATLEKRDSSMSLVMVLLIEGGLAEEPRAALGGAGGKGHRLQHCIEKDKDNSQDKTQDTT